jgi:hypothetical protein
VHRRPRVCTCMTGMGGACVCGGVYIYSQTSVQIDTCSQPTFHDLTSQLLLLSPSDGRTLFTSGHWQCATFIQAFQDCHKQGSFVKFTNGCGDLKLRMEECLREEKKERQMARHVAVSPHPRARFTCACVTVSTVLVECLGHWIAMMPGKLIQSGIAPSHHVPPPVLLLHACPTHY